MKRYLLALLLTAPAGAQVINAASCSQANVQTAMSAITTSTTTINIPTCLAGAAIAWTGSVTLNIPSGNPNTISLFGAGSLSITGGNDQTVIHDNDTADANPLLVINDPRTNLGVRVAGISFIDGTSVNTKANGVVQINGTSTNYRVDHFHGNFTASSAIQFQNCSYGVVDHNIFDGGPVANAVRAYNSGTCNGDSLGVGDQSWAMATNLGTANFLFIENNVFNGGASDDCTKGGRFVSRFNTLNMVTPAPTFQTHPTGGGGRERGCRAWEIYKNQVNANSGNYIDSMFFMSSGTGVIWGNTIPSSAAGGGTGYKQVISAHSMRTDNSTYPQNATPSGWGYCGTNFNGTGSNWDQNSITTTGYHCLDQPGRGIGDFLTGGFTSDGSGSNNVANNATGCTAGSSCAYPRQALEPIYEWMDAYSPVPSNPSFVWVNSTANAFVANTDYYNWCDPSSLTGCTSFTGATGTGSGTLASRPATCTTGVAYWATDQGSWNSSGSGGQGVLYKCTATNTWTSSYTPYAYPHPLTVAITTWYIRADGGTRTQCTGTTDAAYPGSGTGQACGFNDFRWLYDNQTFGNHAWVISGGDIVHVESCVPGSDGPGCQVGFSQGASSGDPWCSGGSGAIGCTPPTIPAGTTSNPTTFRGANFASCTSPGAMAILHGSYDMSQMFDARGSQHILIECLEITGYSSCRTTGDAPVSGDPAAAHICANNYPFDDNMQTGLVTDAGTADVQLQDVYIHRVTNRGIQGPIGGLVDLNRVHIGWSGQTGWDLDDGSGTHSVNATMSIRNSLIEWAGAMEQFPDTLTVPTILQFDDAHGTVADCIGTPDTPLTVVITNSTFRYCSQDGPDIGHIDGNSGGPANVTITSSYFYGNMGQQLKWGGVTNATLTTSELIGNCHRLAAQVGDETDPKTHLSDWCRAAGDTLSFNNLKGGNSLIQGNTFVGYNNEYMLWGCWDNNGAGHCDSPVPTLTLRDNVFVGYSNPAWNGGVFPNLISDNGDQAPSQTTEDHNIFFNLKGGNCGSGGAGDICADPILSGGTTFTSENMFDAFNFNLLTASPAKFTGIALAGVTTDFAGNAYHVPPSMGPLEFVGAAPPTGVGITSNVKITASVKIQ